MDLVVLPAPAAAAAAAGPKQARLTIDLGYGASHALEQLSRVSPDNNINHLELRQWARSYYIADTNKHLSKEELWSVFQALSMASSTFLAPSLQTVVISSFRCRTITDIIILHRLHQPLPLPAEGLTLLLQNCLQLTSLRLDNNKIVCSHPDQFQTLTLAFEAHPSLGQVHISDCDISLLETPNSDGSSSLTSRDETHYLLERLATALASIPTLQMVEISQTSIPAPSSSSSRCCGWNGASLRPLCLSKSLQVLRIRGARFLDDNDIAVMAVALETNTTLKEFWILSCDLGCNGDHSNVGPTAIAKMLRKNKSLEVLGLNRLSSGSGGKEHNSNSSAIVIAQALQSNTTLRGLHMCLRDGPSHQIYDAFAKLLEYNYGLETMTGDFSPIHGASHHTAHQINFYLRLNRNGRRRLFQANDASRAQWVDALCSQKEDLSSVFYLLTKNPALFHLVS